MKICTKCNTEKPIEEFHLHKQMNDRHLNECKTCCRQRINARQSRLRRQISDYDKVRREELRIKAIQHYGGVCYCCGETDHNFLSIDHINNDGKQHRGLKIQEWLKQNNYPEGFRVACYNCNCARQFRNSGGECPHHTAFSIFNFLSTSQPDRKVA